MLNHLSKFKYFDCHLFFFLNSFIQIREFVRTSATANGSNSGHQVPPLPLKVAARHSQIYGRQRSPAVTTPGRRTQNTNFDDSKWMKLNLLEKWETKRNELKIETIDFCNLNFIRMKNIWKNGTRKLIKATSFFLPFETNFLTESNARWPELFRIVHLNPWAFYLNLCFFCYFAPSFFVSFCSMGPLMSRFLIVSLLIVWLVLIRVWFDSFIWF